MWRSAVQLRAGLRYGGIAQLVEHLLCKQRVKSSNLFISTKKKHLQKCRCFFLFLCPSAHIFYSSPPDGAFFVMFRSRKHIQLGNSAPMSFRHLRSGPSTVSCVLLRRTCLRRTPPHYSRSAHQCAGRAVYFAAAKYGKAGRPPGVATLVAVRGLVPPK